MLPFKLKSPIITEQPSDNTGEFDFVLGHLSQISIIPSLSKSL